MKKIIKVGLIGFGTVGTGVARILLNPGKPHLRGRSFDVQLAKIADLDIKRDRGIQLPSNILTTQADDILNDPQIDIVIELMGGYEPAKTFTLRAFQNGKSVVSANKALIARHGGELFRAAAENGVSYMFEASVGGGIPILRSIYDGLNANEIQRVYGILNGTTNYILTAMSRDGKTYASALKKAQELGYAELNPEADVSGADALNKTVILARIAFGANLDLDSIYREGIEKIDIKDIEYARELGYAVKLLAIIKRHDDGSIEARVHPTLVPENSVMASVEDEFNAIEVYGDAVDRQIFYGKGAGMMPTASAVVSDIVDISGRIVTGAPTNMKRIIAGEQEPVHAKFDELKLRYYLRFTVKDRPGVLAYISSVLADENISIESVIQKGKSVTDHVPLVVMTHDAKEGDIGKAMKKFKLYEGVQGDIRLIRVEEV